jgi:hypothetical protein
MQAAYRSGDPYLAFAKQAGAVPSARAVEIHYAEEGLRDGMPLVGQRTEKPERGRVIVLTVCGIGILERPCERGRKKAQHKNDGGDDLLEWGLHGRQLRSHAVCQ